MRHVRTLLFCVIVALAISAVSVAGASAALPEVGRCEEKAGGAYEDAACTVKAHPKRNGHYEWAPHETHFGAYYEGDNHLFEALGSVGPTTLETTSGQKILCADTRSYYGEEPEMEVAFTPSGSINHDTVLITFTNCKEAGGEEKECYSPGGSNEERGEGGTITNFEFYLEEEGARGRLAILSGKGTQSPTVGLLLTPNAPSGEDNEFKRILTAECEGPMGTVWIGGETSKKRGLDTIIAQVGPVDQPTSSLTVDFEQSNGLQKPDTYYGHPRFLEGFLKNEWEQLGIASSWEVFQRGHGFPPVEIKAIK